MKIEEALQYADQWSEGHTFHEWSLGWRFVCATLAAEVRRLRAAQSVRNLSMQMCDRALIKDVFVRHGFKLSNDAGDDLKEYVYEAAESLLAAVEPALQPLTLEQIAGLFNGFFEFPTEDRSSVSSVSCKLFARHIAEIVARSNCEKKPLTDEQIKRGKAEADPERQDLCGWSFEMGVAFAEKSHGITG